MDTSAFSRASAADPHGLISTAQITASGFDTNALARLVRSGELHRVRRGVFVRASGWPADPTAQHRLRTLAVLRDYGGRIAASHHSAAILHGRPIYPSKLDVVRAVRVTGAHRRSPGTGSGLLLGRPVRAQFLTTVDGAPCVSAALAAAQLAAVHGVESGVVTMDAALRDNLCCPEDLVAAAQEIYGGPGARSARRAAELADGLSESPGESRLRVILHDLGFAPELQVRMTSPSTGFTARVDLYLREHRIIIEFDGLVKYRTDATNDGRKEYGKEKRRERALRHSGYEVVRIEWADLDHPERILALIRAAIARRGARG